MVRLYGVIHLIQVVETNFLSVRKRLVPVDPSVEILQDIDNLPKGSKIGIETLNKKDQEEVEEHMWELSRREDLTGFELYPSEQDHYWDVLTTHCEDLDHEVVFLENKELMLKLNLASLEEIKANNEEIFRERRETDEEYHIKLCRHNERGYNANLLCRKIQEIERDNALLTAIKSANIDVAIVGLGHSDFWTANKKDIQEKYGLNFEYYGVQEPEGDRSIFTRFTNNAKPNLKRVYDRTILERSIRLMDQGSITKKDPDYVGIWDLLCPSKGFFEMFVQREENNGKIQGTIEDCLGSAKFSGSLVDGKIGFTKRYSKKLSSEDAIKTNINYKGKQIGEGFCGYFSRDEDIVASAFYLAKAKQRNPIELSRQWHQAMQETDGDSLYDEPAP